MYFSRTELNFWSLDKLFYSLDIKTVNKEKHKERSNTANIEEEKQMLELEFGDTPQKLEEEYLDMYRGIQSEILNTTRFNKNSDLSTTYLGRVDTTKTDKMKVEEMFCFQYQHKGIH